MFVRCISTSKKNKVALNNFHLLNDDSTRFSREYTIYGTLVPTTNLLQVINILIRYYNLGNRISNNIVYVLVLVSNNSLWWMRRAIDNVLALNLR